MIWRDEAGETETEGHRPGEGGRARKTERDEGKMSRVHSGLRGASIRRVGVGGCMHSSLVRVRLCVCVCETGNSSGCSCLVSTQGVRSPYGPAGQWDERIFFINTTYPGEVGPRGMEENGGRRPPAIPGDHVRLDSKIPRCTISAMVSFRNFGILVSMMGY